MKVRHHTVFLLSFMLLFFFTFVTASFAESQQAYEVGTTNLNVRNAPSHDAAVVGHLQPGERVEAFSEQHGWVQTYYDGEVVWVASQYLSPINGESSTSTTHSNEEKVQVTASGVNVRSGPGTEHSVVGAATSGDTYQLIETSGNWVKVLLSSGNEGWIAADFTNKSQQQGSQPVEESTKKSNVNGTLSGYNIVLDPGHGGKDPGSIGFNGVYEKDLINSTTDKVASHLRDAGANVILTRNSDAYISLDDRILISNTYQTDAFVSIHYNAFPVPIVRGTSTYYYAGGEDRRLAQHIQSSLTNLNSVYDRGIRKGDYKVLRENRDLAVLIELGFITNPDELQTMQTSEFQNGAAEAITNGLINYFSQ
ncbi:N-acetylmuramoyl-L-alanine amidase [Virgibacillus sp. MSJ-26]|uniref:N-acetylmuramoyl-L-alanine amidase n=1 Tax=Virgibacillus sp. MSJ-26 TaxID=2841522 RepID=UPI001C0FB1F5|nr:N-acetylmuramoyl-L-alanine amidase [Virgibacillus sp. MSJ-26]MBU5466043.1 N-acetylmuramoyl-L-alanine amidase [Virgibacillus sp. MSJ-26]